VAIKPVYVADTRTLVWGSDDDVVLDGQAEMDWHEIGKVKAGPTATRLRARGLTRRELLSSFGAGGPIEQAVEAARLGLVSAQGPGVPATVAEVLEWLPPAAIVSLGRWVRDASMLDDPPSPAG
jgi:hypothetical protein